MPSLAGFATDHLPASLAGFIDQTVATLRARREVSRKRAVIAAELASYTDRELFDLGIQRADFAAIVRGTYRR